MTTPNNNDDALCLTVDEVGKVLYENCIPLSNGHPAASPEMAIRVLKSAYELALSHYQAISDVDLCAVPDKWVSRLPMPNGAIQSIDLQRCERTLEFDPKGGAFSGWLKNRPTDFETQKFDRAELQRWLEAHGTVSSCSFDCLKAENAASMPVMTPEPQAAPVVADYPAKPRSNKSNTTLIFEAKVLELIGKFWDDRKPGTTPTKGDLCKLVYNEMLRGTIRGERAFSESMVRDAAKPWKIPLVVPAFVPDSQFNPKRHPFKGEK